MERKTKARAETGIYLFIIAAILVIANVISFRLFKRFDITKNERFTLSKGSAHLVREGLNKDLDVTLYVTRGLPKQEAFIQDLTDLMSEYERASQGHFHYTVIEPSAENDPDKRKKLVDQAKEDGMQEAAFGDRQTGGGEKALISKGFMGISLKYGSEKESIPILSPEQSQGLEFWITNKIREIHDRADNKFQKFGVVTGKDEIKLSDANLIASQGGRGQGPTMKGILEQALPFYKLEDVDLQNGDAEINKELVGIIITQPGKDYTEKELRRVDQFLMQGKAVVIMAGAVNLKASDATMKAELSTHGLEKLLEGYGIEMKKEAIFDRGRPALMRVATQGQAVLVAHPAVLLAQHDSRMDDKEQFLDQSFPGFFRMEELVFPFPSTLVAHAEKQPGATVKVVARTTPRATAATGDSVEMNFQSFRSEIKGQGEGQRAIGVTVEGTIKSAFAGKDAEGIATPPQSKDKSRLLVISAAQFLANPFARSGNAQPMPPQMQMMGAMGGDEELMLISQFYAQQYLTESILAFKNILDWMGGDSDLIAVSAKLIGETNLTYSDIQKPKDTATDPEGARKQAQEYEADLARVQQRVQWTMILFPAVLFALFGLIRWRWRESARAGITLD